MSKYYKKLAITNISIILINVFFFGILNFSFTSDLQIIQVLSLTIVLTSIFAFFYLNYILLNSIINYKSEIIITVGEEKPKEIFKNTLEKYKKINISLVTEIDRAILQLDSIDRKQLKLIEVLERNQIVQDDLIQTGIDTDNVIDNNIKYILNIITIWDENEYHDTRKNYIYEENLKKIREVLDRNDEILCEFDIFLSEVLKIKSNIMVNDAGLQTTITVLKKLYNNNIEKIGGNE